MALFGSARDASLIRHINRELINDFVDNKFLALDSLEFRKHLNKITPGVDMNYEYCCPSCSHTQEVVVPLGTGFFWPNAS